MPFIRVSLNFMYRVLRMLEIGPVETVISMIKRRQGNHGADDKWMRLLKRLDDHALPDFGNHGFAGGDFP